MCYILHGLNVVQYFFSSSFLNPYNGSSASPPEAAASSVPVTAAALDIEDPLATSTAAVDPLVVTDPFGSVLETEGSPRAAFDREGGGGAI